MSERKRIVVIGGVAGGASAATRARRLSEDVEITLFERGAYISFANCGLPYHIGGTITERRKLLVQTSEGLYARYDIDVRVGTEITAIDRERREVTAREVRTGRPYRQSYDALVLSPGADPIRPPIPGADDPLVFTLRGMADMDAILKALETIGTKDVERRRAVVVGAGYIGLEMTEALRRRGMTVCLIEKLPHVMSIADPEMVTPLHRELKRQGIELMLGASVGALERNGDRLDVLVRSADPAGRLARIPAGIVILAVGVRPETKLARDAGLEIGPTGGILVDDRMRTSDPFIWAVGDAVEVKDPATGDPAVIPLAGPANRQGRIAADNILGRNSRYEGTQGTAICKVFRLSFALTGLTETRLRRAERPYRKVYLHPGDHAGYYPGAHPMALKLLFDPVDGRILGAQAVGRAGVDKRIDVLATAMRAGMTVFDLEELELCYAPQFGSAKDPVNMAGFVASNVLRGDVELWEPEELQRRSQDQYCLLDVRTFREHKRGNLPGSICAPIDELRDRTEDLPRDRELLVYCQAGLRGYLAVRMLVQRGFRARNLSGGYRRYRMWEDGSGGATPPVVR